MAEDKKPGFKKVVPGSFIWLLMSVFLLALMIQNYIDTRFAKVSFSYQVEHLVNLQLIEPEDSKKTAINESLVTFTGKFREKVTEDGKLRYKYLELLDQNHLLKSEEKSLESALQLARPRVEDSAKWFLSLSGLTIPEGGYVVVDDLYDKSDAKASIVIDQLQKRNLSSLADLKKQFVDLKVSPEPALVSAFGKKISSLIEYFRGQDLGIGAEALKLNLKTNDSQVVKAIEAETPVKEKMEIFEKALHDLQYVVSSLNESDDHIRLLKLRAVRNYKESLDRLSEVERSLEENQLQLDKARTQVSSVIWFFNNQELSTKALERQDPELFSQWFIHAKEEWKEFPENRGAYFRAPDQPVNLALEKTFKSEEPTPNYISYLITLFPIFLILAVLYYVFSKQMKGMGGGAMTFGKSPARLITPKGDNKVTFKDVAGVDEAIEELQEIVEFLKSPEKFTALGGRIPKGVLMIGPPGTGKTLVARAVAGEADRPFFSISGSDFVEMFVGVGASRIRDLFDQAKKSAPCIVFIDEIDAVGRHRGGGFGGGHDEREQTLNQLLVEMDGFEANEGVILMAATNRPDVLDKALLRPGRFDRRVILGLPDIKGRFDILKVHARKIKMDAGVDLMVIAKSTPGCSGADLSNILNEAALLAARSGRSAVTNSELTEARDKVLYGKARRSMELDENERRTTAYHESGHAIVGLVVEKGDPVEKVTILPRGMSLGSTMFLPTKNKVSYWKLELLDRLAVLMGGRCAEEIFVGDISSGAQQDIEQATGIARSMVCQWGMSDIMGAVAYAERSESGQYLGGNNSQESKYSQDTAKAIDLEVKKLLDTARLRALEILQQKKEAVELMTKMLLEFESLDSEDIRLILDGNWVVDEKRIRLKKQEELHKKGLATPPPPPPPKTNIPKTDAPLNSNPTTAV